MQKKTPMNLTKMNSIEISETKHRKKGKTKTKLTTESQ